MDPSDEIYQFISCGFCRERLQNPVALSCSHCVCSNCLQIELKSQQNDLRCRKCSKTLTNNGTESFLPLPDSHPVRSMLATFMNVNKCQTCSNFTNIKVCEKCSKNHCQVCESSHEQTHAVTRTSLDNIRNFNDEEQKLIQTIRSVLNEEEFENFTAVLDEHLTPAALKSNEASTTFESDGTNYDWSKHPTITADLRFEKDIQKIRDLLRLNFSPRPYQIRMIRAALEEKNLLVCLQTGAGKTYIAGMVAKYLYIRRMQASKRFKCVFLVPIRALLDQQCKAFRNVFKDQPDSILKIIETEAETRFKDIYPNYSVFFFTVQKFINHLKIACAKLSQFDLLILDECHHSYDNHPLNEMMRLYHETKVSGAPVPQIIGLTASVGTNKKRAIDHLINLCANIDCLNIAAIHGDQEEEELRSQTNTPLADQIIAVEKSVDDQIISKMKNDVMLPIAFRLGIDIQSNDPGQLDNHLVLIHNNACKNNDHDTVIGTNYLRKSNAFVIDYQDLPLRQCFERFHEELQQSKPTMPTQYERFCQSKVSEFIEFVKSILSQKYLRKLKLDQLISLIVRLHTAQSRGLVLVRTKFHTFALEKFLNEQPKMVENRIRVGRLTGQGSNEDLSLTANQQATVLDSFRSGKINLLVATDVAQEGLDVAECSYVIRYEFVSNEIGAVQSRGRARAKQSQCFLITEAASQNYKRELENRQKECEMKEATEEWHKIEQKEFEACVVKIQNEINENIMRAKRFQLHISQSSVYKAPSKQVLCRFCGSFLCCGKDLKRQGTTVVCVDLEFEKRVNPPQQMGEKILCPNYSCKNEIGHTILLGQNRRAFVLQITALKFIFDFIDEAMIYKQWSSYRGHIESL